MKQYVTHQTFKKIAVSIIIGLFSAMTAIVMFGLSGLMLSKSAMAVPLFTLLILTSTIKLFGVIRAVTRYFERLVSHEATFMMLKEMRVTVTERLLSHFIHLNQTHRLSDLLQRTTSDIEKLQNVFLRVIYPPIIALLTGIITVMMFSIYSKVSAVIILGSVLVMAFGLPFIFARLLRKTAMKRQKNESVYYHYLHEYTKYKATLSIFDSAGQYKARLYDAQDNMEKAIKNEKRLLVFYELILNMTGMIVIFLIIITAMNDIQLDKLMYLSIIMVSITLLELMIPMIHFPYHYYETKLAEQNIQKLNQEKQSVTIPDFNDIQSIELDDISIVLNNERILNHIDLKIQKGESVGIIGPSGAGKSTLMKVLMGLYGAEGTMKVNGGEIELPAELYRYIGLMEQTDQFIEGTIRDNLFIETLNIKDDVIQNLLNQFHLPFKPDSEVHSGGQSLSGGEKKRLQYIRLILHNQPIWILDEPFNGVDINTIKEMKKDINRRKKQHTIIIISHQLDIYDDEDYIYYMNKGTIIESGRLKDLRGKSRSIISQLIEKEQMLL